ncbi:MAG: 3-hydroxyacyl-ACP dehydratase FabZ [Trueperaceae bacterium]|nr:3-hydroxyacyl-ACP dehydratase FabZ [Trueperaceae bacterium]
MDVDIRDVLPHRYPFLLVDRLVSQEGDRFVCVKNVTFNEPYFVGHFPGEPVMPGVLIVEALAQAAAVGLAVREGVTSGAIGYLAGIDGARFRRKVVPGDVLSLEGEILMFRRRLCKVAAQALVDGEVAAEATLSFVFQD